MPCMLQDDGFVAKILVPDGEKDISVGTPLIVLVDDEESVGKFKDYKPSGAPAAAPKSDDTSKQEEAPSAPGMS